MNKTKNRTKALKTAAKKETGFFRALIFGFVSCTITWVLLAALFALIMSKQTDSSTMGNVLSPAIIVISLFIGGFVAGKTDKSCAFLSSFVLGTAFLGISYGLSTAFELSRGLGAVMKTVIIVVMLVCPVLGAKISVREKKTGIRRRK